MDHQIFSFEGQSEPRVAGLCDGVSDAVGDVEGAAVSSASMGT